MGHNSGQGSRSNIPSCCHWWWSCCCCHCSGSFYTDNVVQSDSSNSPINEAAAATNTQDPKTSRSGSQDAASKQNNSDKEALIDPEAQVDDGEIFEGDLPEYPDYNRDYSESDRDSYLERMSGSGAESYDGGRGVQGPYLGSYQRIRHMSGLSEGHGHYPSHSYHHYRSDSYSGASYGPSPEYGHDSRDLRYSSMSRMVPQQGMDNNRFNSYEMQATMQSILKRQGVKDEDGGEEEGEEESAYNEHFKKDAGKPGPGEFRVPSIRVRPTGAPPTITSQPTSQAQDYTGTATEQGKGVKSPMSKSESEWNQSNNHVNHEGGNGNGGIIVSDPPTDRWNLLYLTLVLHGVGTLMPWNIFINAKTQSSHHRGGDWSYLLPDYFVNYKLGEGYSGVSSSFIPFFLQYLALSAQLPNVIFNWINVFFKFSDNLAPRIVWTMLVEILVLIVTIVLAMVDTSHWSETFFYLSLASVVIINMANGVYQNTVYGLAARLPFKYTGAVVLGSNLSGTIVSIINIVCIAISPNPRTAAIYYFITALFMLLACFDTYFALPLNRFYRYHEQLYLESVSEKHKSVIIVISYWNIFKKCSKQLLNIFLVFCVTLTIFPAVLSDIDRVYSSFFISKEYFISLTCFLTFNTCAVIGNILPSYCTWPSADKLWIPIVSRVVFIPFFLLCNYRPAGVERLWPVLFHWDGVYWLGSMMFAVSGGYTASLALMYCPRSVEREYAGIAGMMGAAAIGTGVLAGITLSCLMPLIVSAPALDWELPTFWPAYHPG